MPCRVIRMAFLFLWNFYKFILSITYHMSARSFWTILIRTLGIYTIMQALVAFPSFISSTAMFSFESSGHDFGTGGIFAVAYILLLLGLFGLILWACLFKTDQIIDKLKLNKGIIEEKLGFDMPRAIVLKIAIIVIGGLTLIDSLPAACQELLRCLQKSAEYNGFTKDPTSTYLVYHLIKTAIGIFMTTSSDWIVNYIEKKRREPGDTAISE